LHIRRSFDNVLRQNSGVQNFVVCGRRDFLPQGLENKYITQSRTYLSRRPARVRTQEGRTKLEFQESTMNLSTNLRAWRKLALLSLAMLVPAAAFAQKKNNPPTPAPHASAPAPHQSQPHNAAPANRPATNNANRPNTPTGNRPNTTTGNRPTNTNTMGRPNTMNGKGTGPANNNTNRPANTMNKGPANNNSNRPGGNANMNRPGGNNMNRPGGNTKAAVNRTPPGRQVSLKGGGTANIRPNGQIRSVNRNGMQINHGLHGGRTVVSTHNGARVVTTGARGGYVQRNYVVRNGNTYVSRTYVVNNVSYTSVYRSYGYGGYCCYYGYAPAYYWHPAYYGWAYNPWPAPVYYGWGWGGAPWYGYYGPYFAPYPVYPAAYFWVTDWMLAASLRAAYEAQAEANAELSPLVPDLELVASLGPIPVPDDAKVQMSKEAKDALAEEVKAQLNDEQAEASKTGSASGGASKASGPPPALDPKRRTFVVNDEITTAVDGQECSLTAGDIISRVSDTPDEDRNVDVKVLASKKADCAIDSQVSVAVDDLQEMHNHFREQIAGGMDELSKKQGSGGLPKAPDTGKQDGEVPAPPADTSAAKTLKEQQQQADQTESEVKQEAGSSGGGTQ
jgi:hypothetical protein